MGRSGTDRRSRAGNPDLDHVGRTTRDAEHDGALLHDRVRRRDRSPCSCDPPGLEEHVRQRGKHCRPLPRSRHLPPPDLRHQELDRISLAHDLSNRPLLPRRPRDTPHSPPFGPSSRDLHRAAQHNGIPPPDERPGSADCTLLLPLNTANDDYRRSNSFAVFPSPR